MLHKKSNDPIAEYEERLKRYFKARFCLAVSSGTAALIVALKAVGIQNGDEIITSPVGPLCTAYPIIYSGGKLVFSDIQIDNLGLEQNSLLSKISEKTKAIVEVPMWGYPINGDKSQALAASHSIPLIFDLAHCVGTEFNGRHLSDYCDIACFSSQKNKVFSTGEGGFILTNNKDYYLKALLFSRMGNLNGVDFGINFKLSPILAEIGILALKNLQSNLNLRTANACKLTSLITNPLIREVKIADGGKPSYQRLLLRSSADHNNSFAEYLGSHGIQTDTQKYNIMPLFEYDILKKYYSACPNAERFLSSMVAIAVHDLKSEELKHVAAIINSYTN